jgi:hypothetical protein
MCIPLKVDLFDVFVTEIEILKYVADITHSIKPSLGNAKKSQINIISFINVKFRMYF